MSLPQRWLSGLLFLAFCCPCQAEGIRTIVQPNEVTGSARAVVVDDVPLAHTTQVLPLDANGVLLAPGDIIRQSEEVLDTLSAILRSGASGLDRVAKLNVAVAHAETIPEVRAVLRRRFAGPSKPAVAYVVSRLPHPGALVAMDAVAVSLSEPERAIRIGRTPRLASDSSGHLALCPQGTRVYVAGQAEKGANLAEATRKTMESLRNTLRFLGHRESDVVQLKAFLTPMSNVEEARREMAAFFGKAPVPPMVFVEWKSTLPIEIELIAWGGRDRAGPRVEFLTPPGMTASPIYSRVAQIHHSRTVYISGLESVTPGEAATEVTDVFDQLKALLKATGSDLSHLVKATYYVSQEGPSQKLNELRPKYYDPKRPPSASKAMVSGVADGCGLSLDMIAVPGINPQYPEYGVAEVGHGLTEKEAASGWISLFDRSTPMGWTKATVNQGILSQGETTAEIPNAEVRALVHHAGVLSLGGKDYPVKEGLFTLRTTGARARIRLREEASLTSLIVRPLGLDSITPGPELSGWKRIDHPRLAATQRPTWTVENGVLRAVGGPGALEYQKRPYGDLLLQLEVRTRARHANGGLFLRCIPGDFMNGYEAQIYNRCEFGDPLRPARWSTGAIDDRQMARRLVSRDGVPFTMTALVIGPHLATWVNGVQLTDWLDTRPPHANPRQGRRLEPGTIQLQAHDPGTDLEFSHLQAISLD